MTIPYKGRTTEHADSLVKSMGFQDLVEEYELVDMEHVYTLENGSALIIPVHYYKYWYILEDGEQIDVFVYKERTGMYGKYSTEQ